MISNTYGISKQDQRVILNDLRFEEKEVYSKSFACTLLHQSSLSQTPTNTKKLQKKRGEKERVYRDQVIYIKPIRNFPLARYSQEIKH